MNESQMEAFHLRDVPDPAGGGETQYVDAPGVSTVTGMDVANRGMANSQQYMAANGPTYPIQLKRALTQQKIMTQVELEEQKMNESKGLPSNLEEASRVVTLETTVETMNKNMDTVLALLGNLVKDSPDNQPPLRFDPQPPTPLNLDRAGTLSGPQTHPVAPPPTPQASPVAVPPVPQPLPLPPPQVQVPTPTPVLAPPVPVTAPTTTQPTPPTSTPDFFPHHSTQATESEADRIERIVQERISSIAQGEREVQVEIATQELGDAKRAVDVGKEKIELTEEALSPDQPLVDVVEEPEPAIDEKEQLKLNRQQILVTQTTQWIKVKDPLKFFKRFLGTTCNKNLSFNTWPASAQSRFTERFETMLQDASFISTLCARIMAMDNGHLVAPHVAGAFITVLAGFLSFAMTE